MTCYRPMKRVRPTGWYSHPCGQCIGCRLAKSADWATRCVHEAMCYDDNCFITLTYSNEHLPYPPVVDKREFQLFMKKLRKQYGSGIRFYAGAEYGDTYGRPHYHACLFNFWPPDAVLWKTTPTGDRLYTSKILENIWGKGFVTIGSVTFESAAYIARYCMKKKTGKMAKEHYARIHPETGECYQATPEFALMSRMPGIGMTYLEQYGNVCAKHETVVVSGRERGLPRYYKTKLGEKGLLDLDVKKFDMYALGDHNTERRLEERLHLQHAKMNLYRRTNDET